MGWVRVHSLVNHSWDTATWLGQDPCWPHSAWGQSSEWDPLCLGSPGVGKGLMLPAQGQGLGGEGDFCQIPVLAVPASRAVTHAAPQEQMCEAR